MLSGDLVQYAVVWKPNIKCGSPKLSLGVAPGVNTEDEVSGYDV